MNQLKEQKLIQNIFKTNQTLQLEELRLMPKLLLLVDQERKELPKLEMLKLKTPRLETPRLETPRLETPRPEMLKLEMPKLEMQKLEMPKLKKPKLEVKRKLKEVNMVKKKQQLKKHQQ